MKYSKKTQKINETKRWLFEKINKIHKLLTRLIKKKIETTQINTIRNERAEVQLTPKDCNTIYYQKLYANKLDILHKRDKFLEV